MTKSPRRARRRQAGRWLGAALCAGALVQARVRRLVFGSRDLRFGGVRSKFRLADSDLLNHRMSVEEGLLGGDSVALIERFFQQKR